MRIGNLIWKWSNAIAMTRYHYALRALSHMEMEQLAMVYVQDALLHSRLTQQSFHKDTIQQNRQTLNQSPLSRVNWQVDHPMKMKTLLIEIQIRPPVPLRTMKTPILRTLTHMDDETCTDWNTTSTQARFTTTGLQTTLTPYLDGTSLMATPWIQILNVRSAT